MAAELTVGARVYVKDKGKGPWLRACVVHASDEGLGLEADDGTVLCAPHQACFLENKEEVEVRVAWPAGASRV